MDWYLLTCRYHYREATVNYTYEVRRLDENPDNTYTFGMWVLVSTFKTAENAYYYARRAVGPTQKLRIFKVRVKE
jgi:hypothetical protein